MPAKSSSQQRLFGMIHACQKYGKCTSKNVKNKAKNIDPEAAEEFAATKHDRLPEKKEGTKYRTGVFSRWLEGKLAEKLINN